MKKLLYSFMAVGALAGLASCASDEPLMSGNSDGKVSIEVKLPDFGTRFYGDQLQCNELIYTIFNADGDAIDGVTDVKQDAFGPGVTSETITLNLVPGETYMIAFYAHNKGSLFSAYSNGTIDVNYEKMNVNNEIDDAFYCYVPISTTATEPQSVTLNRAFAQINFGTNDFTNPLVQEVIGSLTASFDMEAGETGLYTSLDTKTNEVSVPQTDAVTTTNSLTANTDFPVANYGNLTSFYVLVSPEEGQMLGKGTYTLNNGDKVLRTVNMANTPVRMNYRTNIYGSMLTTQIPVTVNIEPNFAEENINMPLEAKEPATDANGNYLVSSPEELMWMKEQLEKGDNLAGKTFVQQNDINFTAPFEPIGYYVSDTDMAPFSGVYNGNNKNLNNLTITQKKGDASVAAFFGYVSGPGSEVCNVNINNATVLSEKTAAALVGFAHKSANIHDNTVSNSSIKSVVFQTASGGYDGSQNTGAILGYGDASVHVDNNTVNDCQIQAYRKVGGIAGGLNFNTASGTSFKGNTVNNTVITQNLTYNYKPADVKYVGLLLGLAGNTNPNQATNKTTNSSIRYLYGISTGQELADRVAAVKTGDCIELLGDIDCTGVTFNTTRGIDHSRDNFTLEGNGYTISNFTDNTNGAAYGGLFPTTCGITVRNLTMKNANVTAGDYSGVLIGQSFSTKTIVENVTFENCTISGGKKIGIMEGFINEGGGTFSNITVKNCSVTATGGQAGMIAGYLGVLADGISETFTNCTAINCTMNVGWEKANFQDYGSGKFVGVIGASKGSISFNNCSVSGVTLTSTDSALQTLLDQVGDRVYGAIRSTGASIYVDGVKQ